MDQFGVLHDGRKPYPGAVSALEAIRTAGGRVVLVSNSSRRANQALSKLATMGFDTSLFVGAVTSGELTHRALEARDADWAKPPAGDGRALRALWLTWGERGAVSLAGTGVDVVATPEEADVVLVHGTQAIGRPAREGEAGAEDTSLADLEALCRRVAHIHADRVASGDTRGLPLVCANPDIVTVDAKALAPMPGHLARICAAEGGAVVYMGKPAAIIYDAARTLLTKADGAGASTSIAPSECLMVGDSLEHVVAGAAGAGVDSLFVGAGIHESETMRGEADIDGAAVAALVGTLGVATPTLACARLEP